MKTHPDFIPRPLVLTNQWFIVISVITAWLTSEFLILLIPLAAGIMALVFNYNPVIKLASKFLQKNPSEYAKEDYDQQQFNQTIAVVCLSISLISHFLNWVLAAYIFSAMVALAAFVAILGFCVGCFIRFQWKQFMYRRTIRNQ